MLLYRRSFKRNGRSFLHVGVQGNLPDRQGALFEVSVDGALDSHGSFGVSLTVLRASVSFIVTWDRRKR